ncbi:hypothetical protein AB5N19_00381 [Seiridium cardinale]
MEPALETLTARGAAEEAGEDDCTIFTTSFITAVADPPTVTDTTTTTEIIVVETTLSTLLTSTVIVTALPQLARRACVTATTISVNTMGGDPYASIATVTITDRATLIIGKTEMNMQTAAIAILVPTSSPISSGPSASPLEFATARYLSQDPMTNGSDLPRTTTILSDSKGRPTASLIFHPSPSSPATITTLTDSNGRPTATVTSPGPDETAIVLASITVIRTSSGEYFCCQVPRDAAHALFCALSLSVSDSLGRDVEVLLAVMAVSVLVLLFVLRRRRLGVQRNPWSIAGVAALPTHYSVRKTLTPVSASGGDQITNKDFVKYWGILVSAWITFKPKMDGSMVSSPLVLRPRARLDSSQHPNHLHLPLLSMQRN